MKKTILILMAVLCIIGLMMGFAMAADGDPTPSPTPTPYPTPAPADLEKLVIHIEGPNAYATDVPYGEFTDGKLTLEGLEPGTYTVTEREPENLFQGYTFVADESTVTFSMEVRADETSGGRLRNVYEHQVEETPVPSESPTPEPSDTPSPTPTPENMEDEKITVPVTKIWNDNGNRDGNRPGSVTVHLLADGNRVGQAILSNANGWSWQFTDMPKYANGKEIVYTVSEDAVNMYTASYSGTTVTNTYTPVTTSATVSKIWVDNNNEAGMRPTSLYCTLSNGMHVELNAGNNWTATIEGLPAVVNGSPVSYTWSEQEVLGYEQTDAVTSGNSTVFTNTVKTKNPPREGKKLATKKRGDSYLVIDDYGTPLGVEVVINHVGDCFD